MSVPIAPSRPGPVASRRKAPVVSASGAPLITALPLPAPAILTVPKKKAAVVPAPAVAPVPAPAPAPAPAQSEDKILTSRGYAITKKTITPVQQAALRKDLTVAPKIQDKYSKGVQSFPIFLESPTRFYVPRHWGIQHYGIPEISLVPEGLQLEPVAEFIGSPHDYQEKIISKFIENDAQGLICVPCGKGKTFMALAIALRLRRRFLVVVDKEFLMSQWRSEIEAFTKGIRVGILQAGRVDIEADKFDCTICMIQTLASREYPEGFFDQYGLAIFDECHKLGAPHFNKAMGRIQTRYLLGLSATPTRDDGLTRVFESFLGAPVYWEKTREPDASVIVRAVYYEHPATEFKTVPVNWRGEPVTARLLSQICEWAPRTERIVGLIREVVADTRRQLIVMSERKLLLEEIEMRLAALPEAERPRVGYYVGGMKQEVLDSNAANCQVILATYAMASEALNIKTLNAAILATPRKKVEQSTGRILRLRPDQRTVQPVIVDIMDMHDPYRSLWKKREVYYRKCAYAIQYEGIPEPTAVKVVADANGCMFALGGDNEELDSDSDEGSDGDV